MTRAEKYAEAVDHATGSVRATGSVWKCSTCNDLIPNLYKECPYCQYTEYKEPLCAHGRKNTEPCDNCNPPQEDMVNEPGHYTCHPSGIEPIEITQYMGFCLGNVIKYVMRSKYKGTELEDLKKARFYLERKIKQLGEQEQ